MRLLVWQWGRYGAGPRVAVELAHSLGRVPGVTTLLSLSTSAELLHGAHPPDCALPFRTYGGLAGFVARVAAAPARLPKLIGQLRALKLDAALCAMPAPLDLLMASALRRAGVPIFVVVHDADAHPGDGFPLQMTLQRRLLRRAQALVALSAHVADRLRAQGLDRERPILLAALPPLPFGPRPTPPLAHDGPLRLLSFGRLLPYKGLDLLAKALAQIGDRPDLDVRVVGQGPESSELRALRALPHVRVENRWVPEDELGELIAWSDALVLSHREASQSGAAAAAIAARRWVVSTRVGGLTEQLAGEKLAILCDPDADSLAVAILRLLRVSADAPDDTTDPLTAWEAVAGRLATQLNGMLKRA